MRYAAGASLQRFNDSTMETEVFVHLQSIMPFVSAVTNRVGDKVAGLLTLRTVSEEINKTTFQFEMNP